MSADDIRVYYTGAKSAGSAQPDSAKSVGGFVSGTLMPSMAYNLADAIDGVYVDHVSASCGEGVHAVEASAVGSLRFTAAGDTQGAAVAIANGETKTLYSGTTSKYIIVKRETADDLSGLMSVAAAWVRNNAVAMDNCTTADAAEYRMVALTNQSAGSIEIVINTFAGANIYVAFEPSYSDGFTRDYSVLGDTTEPVGLSFTQGTSAASKTLAAGETVGLWIKRSVNYTLTVGAANVAYIDLVYGGVTQTIRGLFSRSNSALIKYELYRGVDAEIDFGAAAFETFTTLPHDTAALAGGHAYKFVLRQRNTYNLLSQNLTEWEVTTNADGTVAYTPPSAPDSVAVTAVYGNKFLVEATYDYLADDDDDQADTWLVYLEDGSDPDPDTDTPTEVAMATGGGLVELSLLTAAYADSSTLHVLVRTRRTGEADSINATITEAAALGELDAIRVGCEWITGSNAGAVVTVWESGTNSVSVDTVHGWLRFTVGGSIVAGLTRAGVFLGSFVEADLTGTAQVDTFALDGTDLCVAVGGQRVMSITTAGVVTVAAITETGAEPSDVWTSAAHYEEAEGELGFSADLETELFKISDAGLLTIRSGAEQ